MLSNAFALALLTTGGLIAIYNKLPRKMRKIIERYGLLADLFALVGVYMLLGGTLTALVAGAMCGLFVSVLLHIAHEDNKEDYMFLFDLRDFLKEKLKDAKEMLQAYGHKYNNQQNEDSTLAAA